MYVEFIGLLLAGYGIWFSAQGVRRWLGAEKDWWRPLRRQRRYPYPAAGVLLGLCFFTMGLMFALRDAWVQARGLAWVGGGLFVLVMAAGIAQPRFLHPPWYGQLQDRYGKQGVLRLKDAAWRMEEEEWSEVTAAEPLFEAWVKQVMPGPAEPLRRGYKRAERK
jgi:hypothetical protein